jgi:hypothetical protein
MHEDKTDQEREDQEMCEACGQKPEDCKCDKPPKGDGALKPGHMTLKIQIIMEKPDSELEEGDVEELMKHASKNHQRKKFGKSKSEFGKDRFTKGEDDAI